MAENPCGIACNIGPMSLDTLLASMFAKDANGCVGLKLMWLWGVNCESLEPVTDCGSTVTTLEQAINMAAVSDGCDGLALGVYFTFPDQGEVQE